MPKQIERVCGLLLKIAAKMKDMTMGAIRRSSEDIVLMYFMPVSGFVNIFDIR